METVWAIVETIKTCFAPKNEYFVDALHETINKISSSRFVDDIITLQPLNKSIALFLYDAHYFDKIFIQKFGYGQVTDILDGLFLKKCLDTAEGEGVKRKFIDHLHKKTAYCFSLISSGWCLSTSKYLIDKEHKKIAFSRPARLCLLLPSSINDIFIESHSWPVGKGKYRSLALWRERNDDMITICGGEDMVAAFFARMRKESIRTYPSLHLFLTAANDSTWLAGTGLLRELVAKIARTYYSAFMDLEE